MLALGLGNIAQQGEIQADAHFVVQRLMEGQGFFANLAGDSEFALGLPHRSQNAQGVGDTFHILAQPVEMQALLNHRLGLGMVTQPQMQGCQRTKGEFGGGGISSSAGYC